ncbi:4-hydroxy-3-methylbut-2-enyl diphosphate reductase [Streptomyces sp. NA04227]|uniref:4-hydroxy-3-methylbut-2-enyl diphosphate reductase n=1 Tax=Streptomyces sp. NA04227 TaxID=2742136 RepID=UPI00158FC313|nr:4-hydroxy-3-methylbut-2-enyl diphosphate reductase [Streptomyces sp. NA04227]QKW08909.1 4-hydroxy-3-methylbut-2-enyl diphosphate reductase [Streptomyces sp. NA04227]
MTASPAGAAGPSTAEQQGSAATGKRVLLAAPRGYCAGVDRAVIAVEKALEQYGAPVYVRHEIVHNKYVVQTLERKGAIFVERTEEVPEGSIVMFSAHGVAPVVHEEAAERKLATIDATCPLVTKVHKEAVRFANEDYDILLIGHEGHEEVIGTTGEAPDHITLVDGPGDVANVEVRDESKVVWLSQTTLSVDETMETVGALKEKFPQLISPPSDDICYATQNRQLAVKQMGADADLVVVVGSKNSSNSKRLVDVALVAGARAAHLVDFAEEIEESWLEGVTTVGVTSGASVPEVLVEGVLEWLSARGFEDVEIVKAAEESIHFSLPKELRRDLRAEAAALGAGSAAADGTTAAGATPGE